MTNNAEKLLVKDSAWDALGVNSETFFQDFASGIYLDSRVPEDVVKNFDIIKKLVLFGYYVYEFIDVAAEKALITFEMALKLRYQELIGQPATLNLFELINWAASERLFEDDEELVHSARKLRNMAVHPAKFTLAGYLSFEIIQRIVDVINDMYDDLSLRKKRKEEEIRVNRVLTEFSKSGAILEIGGKRLIVFLSVLLHCDNKTSPLKYYVLFWPIFEAKPKNESVEISEPILLRSNEVHLTDGRILFRGMNATDEVKLVPIDKEENLEKYKKWKQEFEARDFPLKFYIDSRVGEFKIKVRKPGFFERRK